jgi:outer membrane autotransporter protein
MSFGVPELRRLLISACCVVCLGQNVSAQPTPFPPGQLVLGPIGNTAGPALPSITTGAQANIYTGSIQGGFIPTAPASVVRTSVPTQFVRFYNQNNFNTLGPAVFPWVATSNSVRGLTAAQVKNVLALPDFPTSAALVHVPAGTCVLGGPGNPALGNFPANPPAVPTPGPWGAAGAPQYYLVGQNSASGCANPQNLSPSNFIIQLNMGMYALAYEPNAGGGNPAAVAVALDHASFPAPFTPMDSVYNSLDLLNFTDPALLRSALSQLGGEINADLVSVSIESSRTFLSMVGQRLRGQSGVATFRSGTDAAVTEDGKTRVWIDASAGGASINGDGDTHDFGLNVAAVVAGLDYQLDPKLKLGGAVGYARSSFSTSGLYSSGFANAYYAALYGNYSTGPFYVDAVAGYGLSDFNVNRVISFPGQQGQTAGLTNSQAFISAMELGYRFQLSNAMSLSPIAGLQVVSLWQNAFSESGAGPLNLDVAEKSLTSVRSLLGVEATHDLSLGESSVLQARLRLAWARELAGTDRTITETFQQLAGANFQVSGARPSTDAAVVSVGLVVRGPVQLFFRYDGLYSSVQQGHSVTGGLAIAF